MKTRRMRYACAPLASMRGLRFRFLFTYAGRAIPHIAFEYLEHGTKVGLILPPPPDGATLEWLTNLPVTGGGDLPVVQMEIKTSRLPLETEEVNQAAAFRFK